jgi:hypothetical protein
MDAMRRRGVAVFAVFFGAAIPAEGQMPPRDPATRPPAPQVGTAVIRGRVVDAETGTAIARARVQLVDTLLLRAPALTDETGGFAFKALPHGSYSITVEKPTYTPSRYPDDGNTLRARAHRLRLADGEVIEGFTVRLFRGGVIAGRVVDAHGDPVEGASVSALRVSKSSRGRPQLRNSASTNDLGEFRLAHLEPGKYVVFVTPRRDVWADMNGIGENDAADSQPTPTFFPGAPSLDQAVPITIDRGRSATAIELSLIESQTATITGIVVDASGEPVAERGSMSVRTIARGLPNVYGGGSAGLKPDGTFRLRLAPGEYELEAQAYHSWNGGSPPPRSEQFGSARLTVDGDVSGVVIQVTPGARISGRVVFDGSSPLPTRPPGAGEFLLLSGSPEGINCRMGRSELAADFTFTVDGAFGSCSVQPSGAFGRWTVKAVTYNGAEMLDQVVTLGAQRFRDVQIVMTDKQTEVTLQVTDERGRPTDEFAAALFAVDKARWSYGSRYVRAFVPERESADTGASRRMSSSDLSARATVELAPPRPDSIVGLPPGDYFAVALDDMEADTISDPDTLERLSRAATRIALVEGAKVDVTLRRIKLSDFVPDR